MLVAAPALCLALPGWRERGAFLAAACGTGVLGFLPWLIQEPALLVERIAGYGGSPVVTQAGVAIWGIAHTPTSVYCGGGSTNHCSQLSNGLQLAVGLPSERSQYGEQHPFAWAGQLSTASGARQAVPGWHPLMKLHSPPGRPSPAPPLNLKQTNSSEAEL